MTSMKKNCIFKDSVLFSSDPPSHSPNLDSYILSQFDICLPHPPFHAIKTHTFSVKSSYKKMSQYT